MNEWQQYIMIGWSELIQESYMDGLVQDYTNCSGSAMELLPSCTKSLINCWNEWISLICHIHSRPRKHLSCDAFVIFGCERIVRDGPLYTHIHFGGQIGKLARVTFTQYMSLVTQSISLYFYTFRRIWDTPCKQGKSERFDKCDRPGNLTKIGFKSSNLQPMWPWNVMDDLKQQ